MSSISTRLQLLQLLILRLQQLAVLKDLFSLPAWQVKAEGSLDLCLLFFFFLQLNVSLEMFFSSPAAPK